jgi:hypothetical protein
MIKIIRIAKRWIAKPTPPPILNKEEKNCGSLFSTVESLGEDAFSFSFEAMSRTLPTSNPEYS